MNRNNNNKKGQKQRNAVKQAQAQLKAEMLNELRAAAGQPAKGRGRGKAKRQANQNALTGKGSTKNFSGYGNKQSMPIWESEYVAEIIPSAAPSFSLQQFPVNPGQVDTFPWLSAIAERFEKYEFEFLDFVYKREVSEFATNGVTGKVIMSFDSDASDPAPSTKQQMEDTDPHADCMPCENMRLRIPQNLLKKLNDAFFVRPAAVPSGGDIKTYDIGTLNVACQGTAANTAVGELHVEYALRLRVPVLENRNVLASTITNDVGTGIATGNIFGSTQTVLGDLVSSAGASNLSLKNLDVGAEYVIAYQMTTTGGSVPGVWTTPVGCTIKTQSAAAGGGFGVVNWCLTITATATTASIVPVFTLVGAYSANTLFFCVAKVPTSAR